MKKVREDDTGIVVLLEGWDWARKGLAALLAARHGYSGMESFLRRANRGRCFIILLRRMAGRSISNLIADGGDAVIIVLCAAFWRGK